MIEAWNLTKKFDHVLAVDNLSLTVGQGQILGLLGPNGAGKTTTIRMLATLISPTSGRIAINGLDGKKESSQIRAMIGLLTEAPGMYEKISAYANLSYFSSFYGLKEQKKEKNIEKFLKMFGLWDRRQELVGTYSKGMKQKLALARALIHEPKILFLDEPTSGLDPESARMVRDFIVSLKEEKTTVILCTHNLHEASSLCDRVCIIKKQIIKEAALHQLQSTQQATEAEIIFAHHAQKYASLLKKVPGVQQTDAKGNRMRISVKNPEKTNPLVVKKLVEHEARLVYFHEMKQSLEEIYLKIIGKDNHA